MFFVFFLLQLNILYLFKEFHSLNIKTFDTQRMKNLIKIALVDENIFFRKGLVSFVNQCENFKIVISTSNYQELIDIRGAQKPDIILLDIKMILTDGKEITRHLFQHFPKIKVIITTNHSELDISCRLIKMGVHGFLLKDVDTVTLIDAINTVFKHQYYFAGWDLKEIIVSHQQIKKDTSTSKVKFTIRELEIIELVCQQYTNKEISGKLFISSRTVDNYRDKILLKTNSKNTVGLVIYAMKNDLITINA